MSPRLFRTTPVHDRGFPNGRETSDSSSLVSESTWRVIHTLPNRTRRFMHNTLPPHLLGSGLPLGSPVLRATVEASVFGPDSL
jgi:hypothetical protein